MRPSTRSVLRTALRFAPFPVVLVTLVALLPVRAHAAWPAHAPTVTPPAGAPTVTPSAGTPSAGTPTVTPPVDGGPKPTEGAKGEAHQSLVPPKVEEPEEPPPVGPVERLPPTAYPEWKVRGIYGGSLWLSDNFHGMPWPYYPKTGIGISGSAWLDTGYEVVNRATPSMNQPHQVKYMLQQGRGLLRVTPTYSRGAYYLQAQAELIANKDQTNGQAQGVPDIDDLWIRMGKWKAWDVQAGRFQAFEVYHFGMGLDLNTLERRGAFDLRGLPDVHGFGMQLRPPNVGNVAFHVYPTSALRVEVLAQVGNDGGLNTVGGRPAVVYDLGFFKLKASAELRRQSAIADTSQERRSSRGATIAAQFVLDPRFEAGLNFDYGYVDHWNPLPASDPITGMSSNYDRKGSVTTISFGGFANVRLISDLLLGLGANYITQEDALPDEMTGEVGRFTHLQAFGALQYAVYKRMFVKVVGGYARGHIAQSNTDVLPWDNSMVSGRVRFLYLF